MSDNDNDPPNNVIPFGGKTWVTISQQLVEYYRGLVEEELPDGISSLMKKFQERIKERSDPDGAEAKKAGVADPNHARKAPE